MLVMFNSWEIFNVHHDFTFLSNIWHWIESFVIYRRFECLPSGKACESFAKLSPLGELNLSGNFERKPPVNFQSRWIEKFVRVWMFAENSRLLRYRFWILYSSMQNFRGNLKLSQFGKLFFGAPRNSTNNQIKFQNATNRNRMELHEKF